MTTTTHTPQRRTANQFVDACGIAFDDHRLWLPPRCADWPKVKSIKDRLVAVSWRAAWTGLACWWCRDVPQNVYPGWRYDGELHHLARYDLPVCFSWLCSKCHRHSGDAVTADALGHMLYLKWKHDKDNLSWVHLALAHGKHLQ